MDITVPLGVLAIVAGMIVIAKVLFRMDKIFTPVAKQESPWQTIESAPKDGTVFLAWSEEWREPFKAYWNEEREQWWSPEIPMHLSPVCDPQLWIPLPSTPTSETLKVIAA